MLLALLAIKMKRTKFIISFFVTVSVIVLAFGMILLKNHMSSPKEYTVGSYVEVSNNKGPISNFQVDLKDCVNDKKNFQIKINAGAIECKDIIFEVSVLVNYKQSEFFVNSKKQQVFSFCYHNQDKFVVEIDKNKFNKKNNQFILNIRQDIKTYSVDNDFVRDSSTINLRYNIINNNSVDKDYEYRSNQNLSIEEKVEDLKETTFNIHMVSENDKTLLKKKKNEKVTVAMEMGGSKLSKRYVVFAYMNSKQVLLNNEFFQILEIEKGYKGKANMRIQMPSQSGRYELEIFCVPSPFQKLSEKNFAKYSVLSGKRYTVDVV